MYKKAMIHAVQVMYRYILFLELLNEIVSFQ